jgi:NADH-quinone oxidoreductase subunit J
MMQADALFFWILAPLLVVSAFAVIVAKNPVHSVLFLILSFVCAAGLFLLMGAEFLAMILVVVYVGAVAVLFLFVVMLLDVDFARLRQGFVEYLPQGLLIALVVGIELIYVVAGLGPSQRAAVAATPALHPLFLLLPGGRNDSAHCDDRRDRSHSSPQAEREAPEHRRTSGSQP